MKKYYQYIVTNAFQVQLEDRTAELQSVRIRNAPRFAPDAPDYLLQDPLEMLNKGIIPTPPVPSSKSVAILYKAIQELKAEIDILKADK